MKEAEAEETQAQNCLPIIVSVEATKLIERWQLSLVWFWSTLIYTGSSLDQDYITLRIREEYEKYYYSKLG